MQKKKKKEGKKYISSCYVPGYMTETYQWTKKYLLSSRSLYSREKENCEYHLKDFRVNKMSE